MNEFERQIRDAISAARSGARQAEQSLTNPIWQAKSSMASLGSALPRSRGQRQDEEPEDVEPPARDTPGGYAGSGAGSGIPRHIGTPGGGGLPSAFPLDNAPRRTGIERPGVAHGRWENPYIAAAMPLLLLVERLRDQRDIALAEVRPQIVRELQYFQQRLKKQGRWVEDVDHQSYLLCTYIDEIFTGLQVPSPEEFSLSLLVEFHRNAWGGEDCFEHLQHYMDSPQQNREVLEFYDLILSLGFEGKFRMIERGPVLLRDLRTHMNTLLYGQNPTQQLTTATTEPVAARRRRGIRAMVLLCWGVALCLLAWGITAWYLHEQARQIRSDILAWVPPEPRKINIMETLPNPLSQILTEGWLEVRKDPRGWLLIFTSDGAFRTGSAVLSEEFVQKRNIERLGQALAPWPGDLEVIGHTDSTPFRNNSLNSNLKLSEARAQVVADTLRETTNINQTHQREISSIGRGESEPLADNATEEGRRRNRRVDILWKVGQREADRVMQEFRDSAPLVEGLPSLEQ